MAINAIKSIPMVMYGRVFSTQATAKRNKRNGVIHCAWYQKQGYGRKGDRWASPYGRGLYMSIAVQGRYEPSVFMRNILQIVRKYCRLHATMPSIVAQKSPNHLKIQGNDIYMDGKKLAGIIAEVHDSRTIIGIGVNIRLHKSTVQYAHLEPEADESRFSNIQYDMAQSIARNILFLYG